MIPPNTILEGCSVRVSIPIPDELTDDPQRRQENAERRKAGERKWTPWKKISGWKISKLRYKDLGPVWTEHHEYRL